MQKLNYQPIIVTKPQVKVIDVTSFYGSCRVKVSKGIGGES